MVVLLPVLAWIVGLLMYALAVNPKVQEIGRIMFFCGLFVMLLQSGPEIVRLFRS